MLNYVFMQNIFKIYIIIVMTNNYIVVINLSEFTVNRL